MGKAIIVTGGRDFRDRELLYAALDCLRPSVVYVGCARGADELAREYCRERGVPCKVYRADWEKHGRRAGPVRNCLMLDENIEEVDEVLAFPGGSGTAHMTEYAIRRKVPVTFAAEISWPKSPKPHA